MITAEMTADRDAHGPYDELAVRHVMGALDRSEASAFRSHLLDCHDCRARVGELRSIASELATVERDERRERAAKLVETKERETDQEDLDEDLVHGAARGSRAMVVVGVLLIIILSVWNFVLRGQNEGLQSALEAEQDSAEVINFGQAWDAPVQAAGVEGIARVEQGSLAVMVRGTDDRAPYQANLYDADGGLLASEPVTSLNQQVRYFRHRVPAAVARVDVVLNRSSGQTVVFRAVGPTPGTD